MNQAALNTPPARLWTFEATSEQVIEWLRAALEARLVPAIAQVAAEFALRQWAGKRVRLTLEVVP